MTTHTGTARAAASGPAMLWAARLALLPGLFPPAPTGLTKRVRRSLLVLLTAGSTGGAIAWLVFFRESALAWPLALAIAASLLAAATPWHSLAEDSFAAVGIASAAWVAWFVFLTGGASSGQAVVALVPVLVCALGVSHRIALPLALGAAASAALPLLYGTPSEDEVRSTLTLVAILAAVAVLGASVMREARAVVDIERTASKRSEYYSLVAHELRNPLIGLRSMAKVLARQLPDAPQLRYIEAMEAEANAALALLDGLSDVASIESGRLRLVMRPLELCGIVREIVGALQSPDHPIEVTGIDAPVMVRGDDRRLGQVLRNLITNASKYSPEGSPIRVSLSVARGAAVIAVHDAGPGVPVDERPQLFQKFTRLSTAGGTRGSGLGLYISRMIVRDHDGELWAEWPAEGGSIFSFSVPLASGG
ncbi:MAG TPA: HAMP domain-containing sensor histidine kinase [Candidatus Limnocylindria bacterium]|nr:HAMP domain-containing sensor histidine kinase [Candidatus Limnocylindria bacterium]